jgi:YD repeat-containing protein
MVQVVDSVTDTITRSYDGMDRLISEVTPQGSVSYSYDAFGWRTSMTVSGQSAEHKLEEASVYAQRALPIQEKAYGPESLQVSPTLNRLAGSQKVATGRSVTRTSARDSGEEAPIESSLDRDQSRKFGFGVFWRRGNLKKQYRS